MMGPQGTGATARALPNDRLHLQHGPIDLILGAEGPGGARQAAFAAAQTRFAPLLADLVADLGRLRRPAALPWQDAPATAAEAAPRRRQPLCDTAQIMTRAAQGHDRFVTPMAAVAGAVAETILAAMTAAAPLSRAYVNNGGDIALHLTPGTKFDIAIAGLDGGAHGSTTIHAADPVRGVATSGRGGRSLTLGIADSVTVLARTAAEADVAATLIANATDLPGHPAIARAPAATLRPDSDLGHRPAVTGVGLLAADEIAQALDAGAAYAAQLAGTGRLVAAALTLRGTWRGLGWKDQRERRLAHA